MPLCLHRVRPVEPQPVKGRLCISRNETMFWSNPGLFLNCSTRLKRTSGAKFSSFCRRRSTSSKMTRTLSFFFTLFGTLELAGEEIIHHQRRDERGDAKILLRIVVVHVEPELIAAVDQPGEKFVHAELSLIRPLTDRVHQPPPA